MIRLSIVTPSLNSASFIRGTIESTLAGCPDGLELEHIVVDGGSNDQTISIVSEYPHIRLIEGTDEGPASAQNRGLALATGDYVLFLMSDDLVAPGALQRFLEHAVNDPQVEIWTGGIDFFSLSDEGSVDCHKRLASPAGPTLELKSILYGSPMLPSRIFKRSVFEVSGHFDERYQMSNDRELMVRCYLANIQIGRIFEAICRCRIHSNSRTMGGNPRNIVSYLIEHLKWSGDLLLHSRCRSMADTVELFRWTGYECLRLVWYSFRCSIRV